ncbi:MAG: SH3 domain-containing protein [Clostridiales bacterium]|nr:SH3 domain-containing protein [Clostridiales bacterium]
MNRKRFTTALIAAMLVGVICLGAVACKKKPAPTESTPETSELTTTTTTTMATTTLTEYTGPLTNTVEINWNETQLESPVVYYCKVTRGEFLNVREGPNTTYRKVGTLTRGQSVKIVARCNGGWVKTEDGFYVSETYLQTTMPD